MANKEESPDISLKEEYGVCQESMQRILPERLEVACEIENVSPMVKDRTSEYQGGPVRASLKSRFFRMSIPYGTGADTGGRWNIIAKHSVKPYERFSTGKRTEYPIPFYEAVTTAFLGDSNIQFRAIPEIVSYLLVDPGSKAEKHVLLFLDQRRPADVLENRLISLASDAKELPANRKKYQDKEKDFAKEALEAIATLQRQTHEKVAISKFWKDVKVDLTSTDETLAAEYNQSYSEVIGEHPGELKITIGNRIPLTTLNLENAVNLYATNLIRILEHAKQRGITTPSYTRKQIEDVIRPRVAYLYNQTGEPRLAHFDYKPSNVFVSTESSPFIVFDWAHARIIKGEEACLIDPTKMIWSPFFITPPSARIDLMDDFITDLGTHEQVPQLRKQARSTRLLHGLEALGFFRHLESNYPQEMQAAKENPANPWQRRIPGYFEHLIGGALKGMDETETEDLKNLLKNILDTEADEQEDYSIFDQE